MGEIMSDPNEVEKWMKKISFIQFGGRWSVKDQMARQKISTHLKNINGVVKTKVEYHKDSSTFPSVRLDITMHDGEYRDQVIYQKVSFNETVFRRKDNKVFLYYENANVEISNGRLYSIAQDHNCMADVKAVFEINSSKNIDGTIKLSTNGTCLPSSTEFTLKYPNEYAISKRRVFNYVIILSCLLIGYCYVTNKQCLEAEQNQATAIRMSMTTLSWNTIWNFCLFNIYLSYALQLQDYGYFAIPACMYFIL